MANDEWMTPPHIIGMARAFMGSIDLDPASSEKANRTVRATHYRDKDNSGLECEWFGNVWLNPPYSKGNIQLFANKLLEEWKARRFDRALILVNNATDTKWFQSLAIKSLGLCFISGRLAFLDSEGVPQRNNRQGQVLMYFERKEYRMGAFSRCFAQLGVCLI